VTLRSGTEAFAAFLETVFGDEFSERLKRSGLELSRDVGAESVVIRITDLQICYLLDLDKGRWSPAAWDGDWESDCVVRASSSALVGIAEGSLNAGVALRSGQVIVSLPKRRDDGGGEAEDDSGVDPHIFNLHPLLKLFAGQTRS